MRQRFLLLIYGLGSGWNFASYGVAAGTALAFGLPAVLDLPTILLVGLVAGPALAATGRYRLPRTDTDRSAPDRRLDRSDPAPGPERPSTRADAAPPAEHVRRRFGLRR